MHASIAAADVVCCKRIGQYAIGGDSHSDAIGLLGTVKQPDGSALAKRLKQVLDVKTKAAYTHRSVTAAERRRAQRAAEALVQAARGFAMSTGTSKQRYGEGGIRTHEAAFTAHTISSRAP